MNKKAKNVLFAIIIVILLLGIVFAPKIAEHFQKKTSYAEFMSSVNAGKIKYVDITESSDKMTYYLKGDKKTYYTSYPGSDDFKERLLKKGVEIKTHSKDVSASVIRYVDLVIIVLIFAIFAKSMSLGGNIEVIESGDVKTTFKDVAGMDEIKKELLNIADLMKNKEAQKSGVRIPHGILLEGPPGNGKTLLARAFAGETGVNFIATTSSDFSSQFVGIGSSRVKELFSTARKNTPCVVFIDEIDGVGARRATSSDAAGKEMNTILTSLLNEIDGFKPTDNIMVLAATNRVGDLDNALIRPGRFDRQFVVERPDKAARRQLLKQYLKEDFLDSDFDFDKIADRLFGYSSSEIETVCNESMLAALSDKRNKITADDIEKTIINVSIKGSIKEKYDETEKQRLTTAYHEAGHAVLGHYLTNMDISTVSIKPTTSGAGGFTISHDSEKNALRSLSEMYGEMEMEYGGRAAEYHLGGGELKNVSSGPSADISAVTEYAADYICLRDGIDYSVYGDTGVDQLMKKTEELLSEVWKKAVEDAEKHWDEIDSLAHRLLKDEIVTPVFNDQKQADGEED